MKRSILISAGEASGDLHASKLVRRIKALNPDADLFGLGGELLQREGVRLVERMDKHAIVGAWEAIVKLSDIRRIMTDTMSAVEKELPDLAILVDYPGFNLDLAGRLKARGITVVYFITPQVWAWGASRIRAMRRNIDKALTILPFEERFFATRGLDATYVGHPLLDSPSASSTKTSCEVKRIALLPGSRDSEVSRMLPTMLRAAENLMESSSLSFTLLKSSSVSSRVYDALLSASPLPLEVITGDTAGCLSKSDFALVSSGTATLECALHDVPMIIMYETSFLTAFLIALVSRTEHFGLVNIITGRSVSPEFLQFESTPHELAKAARAIIGSSEAIESQREGFKQLKKFLGGAGAIERAAKIIVDMLA